MNASELIAKGYRRISIRHKMISRIDREDWRDYMAQKLHRPVESMTDDIWGDHYRRCFSKDVIVVDGDMIKQIPTSSQDRVGYINKKEVGMDYYVWCMEHELPQVGHSDLNIAVAEAQRLAGKHKGCTFVVVQRIMSVAVAKEPTFGDIKIGQKFGHNRRVLVKTEKITHHNDNGYRQHYNAIRIEPAEFAGRFSSISDDTVVEPL